MARKQGELPGTEAPHIKEVEETAESYRVIRNKRMRFTEQEVIAQANLVTVLQAHVSELSQDANGNPTYRYDDQLVILKLGHAKAKVKTDTGEDDDNDED